MQRSSYEYVLPEYHFRVFNRFAVAWSIIVAAVIGVAIAFSAPLSLQSLWQIMACGLIAGAGAYWATGSLVLIYIGLISTYRIVLEDLSPNGRDWLDFPISAISVFLCLVWLAGIILLGPIALFNRKRASDQVSDMNAIQSG